jgi:hypothetical protein
VQALTASLMTPATMSGRDSVRRWEAPSTSVTLAPARSLENRCSAEATGRSAVPKTAQDGFARHAAAVAGSSNAVAATGRCEIARNAVLVFSGPLRAAFLRSTRGVVDPI